MEDDQRWPARGTGRRLGEPVEQIAAKQARRLAPGTADGCGKPIGPVSLSRPHQAR